MMRITKSNMAMSYNIITLSSRQSLTMNQYDPLEIDVGIWQYATKARRMENLQYESTNLGWNLNVVLKRYISEHGQECI